MNLTHASLAIAIGVILGGLWVIISIQIKHAHSLERLEQAVLQIELKLPENP